MGSRSGQGRSPPRHAWTRLGSVWERPGLSGGASGSVQGCPGRVWDCARLPGGPSWYLQGRPGNVQGGSRGIQAPPRIIQNSNRFLITFLLRECVPKCPNMKATRPKNRSALRLHFRIVFLYFSNVFWSFSRRPTLGLTAICGTLVGCAIFRQVRTSDMYYFQKSNEKDPKFGAEAVANRSRNDGKT